MSYRQPTPWSQRDVHIRNAKKQNKNKQQEYPKQQAWQPSHRISDLSSIAIPNYDLRMYQWVRH